LRMRLPRYTTGPGEVVEGSVAVGLAAVLSGQIDPGDKQTAAVVTGANIDPDKLGAVLKEVDKRHG
jgi:threonine dehydratase